MRALVLVTAALLARPSLAQEKSLLGQAAPEISTAAWWPVSRSELDVGKTTHGDGDMRSLASGECSLDDTRPAVRATADDAIVACAERVEAG